MHANAGQIASEAPLSVTADTRFERLARQLRNLGRDDGGCIVRQARLQAP
jgi:hypothetical protein